MTKIIAFYLPQFHTFPENDKWWGKGFTEWVNVRKAKPLFSGHRQPVVPLNDNYYDLTNADSLRWQASLMESYKVDGLCFYHYWFTGKKLLHKPAELLLENTDINMPFCFSWANEPWARTWDGKNHHILMPQDYAGEDDWRAHFNYLLPFFRDPRYIKINGKPMLLIYKTASIPCLPAMLKLWEDMALQNGLPGMHIVETLRGEKCDPRPLGISARVEFEPARTNYQQGVVTMSYKRIRRRIIGIINKTLGCKIMQNKPFRFADVARRSIELQSPEGTYGGVFAGWDNTARRGLASTIVLPPTKQEFANYLAAKIRQTQEKYHTDFVFVNAWNEWAEGAILEPDTINRYNYLEAIREQKNQQGT